MEKINENLLNQVLKKIVHKKNIFGVSLCVEDGDSLITWAGEAGNIQKDDQYFLTSVTKLCVTAVILRLRYEKQIQLEDKIYQFFSNGLIDKIHVFNEVDYSKEITVLQLLSNTSGIPDYLSYKQNNGKTADYNLFKNGKDEAWPLDKTLEVVKKLKGKFRPGQKGKVLYSNTNYKLLGAIIENITGKKIAEVFKEYIFDELKLSKTYVYQDVKDKTPLPMYYKSKELHISQCIASVTAEGGVVSTSKETMTILKSFFKGHFFPKVYLDELKKWNFIFFPLQSYFGIGLEKLWVPRILSPLKPIKEVLGFWGSSGAFAFYNVDTNLYFTGTVNQASGFGHSAAFKGIIKIIKSAL